MFVNLSGLCATTKLLQCRGFGITTVDVTRKFQQSPGKATDLHEDDFNARKDVIEQVQSWMKKNNGPDSIKWAPILYAYEVYLLNSVFWCKS